MKSAGVALHAITSETGGAEALKYRLGARHCANLPFPVHSDPDARLCAKPGDDYYITQPFDAGEYFKGDYVGVSYNMVQPALEIVDKSGAVVQKWSWHSITPPPTPMDTGTKIQVDGETMLLVQARPMSADILPAIKEGRNVKLSPAISKGSMVCALVCEKCTIM